MADLEFELDDGLIGRLRLIARSRDQTLEDYLRDLIIAEGRLGDEEIASKAKAA